MYTVSVVVWLQQPQFMVWKDYITSRLSHWESMTYLQYILIHREQLASMLIAWPQIPCYHGNYKGHKHGRSLTMLTLLESRSKEMLNELHSNVRISLQSNLSYSERMQVPRPLQQWQPKIGIQGWQIADVYLWCVQLTSWPMLTGAPGFPCDSTVTLYIDIYVGN